MDLNPGSSVPEQPGKQAKKKKHVAVGHGRNFFHGIVESVEIAKSYVEGWPDQMYRVLDTEEEAIKYIEECQTKIKSIYTGPDDNNRSKVWYAVCNPTTGYVGAVKDHKEAERLAVDASFNKRMKSFRKSGCNNYLLARKYNAYQCQYWLKNADSGDESDFLSPDHELNDAELQLPPHDDSHAPSSDGMSSVPDPESESAAESLPDIVSVPYPGRKALQKIVYACPRHELFNDVNNEWVMNALDTVGIGNCAEFVANASKVNQAFRCYEHNELDPKQFEYIHNACFDHLKDDESVKEGVCKSL